MSDAPPSLQPSPPFLNPLVSLSYPSSRHFSPASPPVSNSLPSYWTSNFTSSLTHTGSTAELPKDADVVIVGSGLTGSSAVAELVDRLLEHPVRDAQGKVETTRVVVLEAREFSSGATGRNGGHLTAYPIAHFSALAAAYGTEDAVRAVKLEDAAIDWLLGVVHEEGWEEDVDLQEGGGTLILYDSPSQLTSVRASLDAARSAGLDSTSKAEFFTAEEAKKKFGAKCEGGIMVQGNNLYPLKFTTKLFQRAQKKVALAAAEALKTDARPPVQLELFTHTVVSGVESLEGGHWKVKTDRGSIETTHVLHATNGYLSSILPSYASSPTFPGILPTRGQVLSLSFPSPLPSNPHSTWSNAFSPSTPHPAHGVNTYAFQRWWSAAGERRGEIIIGGMREHTEGWEWGNTDDTSVDGVVGRGIRGSLEKSWPGVFQVEGEEKDEEVKEEGKRERLQVQREWTGVMGYREEGNPIVGPVYIDGKKQDGQWVSAGYSGHGMPRAPPSGRLVASLIHHHLLAASSSSSSTSCIPPAWTLPDYFPRHLLATPDGKGSGTTKLVEEGEEKDEKKRREKKGEKDGWVWVKRRQ